MLRIRSALRWRMPRWTSRKRAVANTYAVTYTYDGAGNRLTRWDGTTRTTSSYDAANQRTRAVASGSPTTYSYDGAGNLARALASGQRTTYAWDGESRLTQAALPSGTTDAFAYNGDGQRVQKVDSAGTTKYAWEGQNVLLEANASNTIQAVHTLAPALYGDQVSQRRGTTSSYYHFDALGSTLQLTGSTGASTDSYLYRAFGDLVASSGTTTNPYRFVGRLGYSYDVDLANYHVRARRYDPATSRWLSRDPIGFGGGDANLYRYAGNSPSTQTDPNGRQVSGGPYTFPGYNPATRDQRYRDNSGYRDPASSRVNGPWKPSFGGFVTYPFRWLGDQVGFCAMRAAPAGTGFAQDLYRRALEKDPGDARNPKYIVDAFTDPWKQIYFSSEFQAAVASIKQRYSDSHPDIAESGSVPINYASGPLLYAIGHASVEYTYTPKQGCYEITIKLTDLFDFDRFITPVEGPSKGPLANDFARMLQGLGSLTPFEWETWPIQVYGKK
jgi:RHS repeat-associated protein